MTEPPRRHTLADHWLGGLAGHAHSGEDDHDHDHDEDPRHEVLQAGRRTLESAPFVSIGVDVGSAGTQIVFSRLAMRGPGEPVSLRRLIKSRETIWSSPVVLTPWTSGGLDVEELRDILDRAFTDAGVHPDDVETGAVILTGDAASSENARAILDVISEDAGELVCAIAGHHMEAMLAAWGSGAVRRSMELHARILLIDIGGGTTKFAVVDDGRVVGAAALRIGARLVAFDESGVVVRLADSDSPFARSALWPWRLGEPASPAQIERCAEAFAQEILSAATTPNAIARSKWLTEPPPAPERIDGVMFSGGVAEYVYDREERTFGDLGAALGSALRRNLSAGALPWPLLPAGEGIRATALGASEHSLQISGETSFISSPGKLLPRRSLQVVAPTVAFSPSVNAGELGAAIRTARSLFDLDGTDRTFALALRWRGDPDHARLRACAQGVFDGLSDLIEAGAPIFLLVEGDVALNLAGVLRQELGLSNELLVIDGIVLRNFDWVDIGRLRLPSNTVPVTVKSLMFGMDQKTR